MSGYTRQSVIQDGDTIFANLFNNEFNQIVEAFDRSVGHTHNGSSEEGAFVPLISNTTADTQVEVGQLDGTITMSVEVSSSKEDQVVLADGLFRPVTDGDVDLGSSSFQFNDIYASGTITAGNISGAAIGTDVQAHDSGLDDISGLTPTNDNFIVGDGTNWVAESGDTAVSSLGISATTFDLSQTSGASGNLQNQIDQNSNDIVNVYNAKQDAHDNLDDISNLGSPLNNHFIVGDGSNWVRRNAPDARNHLQLGTAAVEDIQTSATDDASDRVLTVGAGGLLGEGPRVVNNNIDDQYVSGMYSGRSGNHPNATLGDNPFNSSGGAFAVWVHKGDAGGSTDYVVQEAIEYAPSGDFRKRIRSLSLNTNGWSPWKTALFEGDYGLGFVASPQLSNLNTNNESGFYFAESGSTGGTFPSGVGAMSVVRSSVSGGTGLDLGLDLSSDDLYWRQGSSSPGNWKQVASPGEFYSWTSGLQLPNTNGGLSFGDSDVSIYWGGTNLVFQDFNGANFDFRTSSASTLFRFDMSSGNFHANGDLVAASNSTGSDRRFKRNITDIDGAEAQRIVKELEGKYYFNIKTDRHDSGLVAQEVESIEGLEHLVTDSIDTATGQTRKFLNYQGVIPYLIAARNQDKKDFEARLAALEAKVGD